MPTSTDAVVIGGGVHGASIAYHLAKKGMRVILIEKRFLAAGGTGKSTAVVRMHYDNRVESQLAFESFKYFGHWADLVGGDAGFVKTGFVRIVIPSEAEALKANIGMLQEVGINTRLVTREEFHDIEPSWNLSNMQIGAYEPDSGYADPQATTLSFAEQARELGARILQETAVLQIHASDSRVTGVQTDRAGEIAAPVVVVAAGPWSPRLVKPLGIDLPIACERHQVASFIRPNEIAAAHVTCIDGANEMYFRPEGKTLTLVGCGVGGKNADPDNYKEGIDDEHIAYSGERLARRIPKIADALSQGGWSGFYDMTPDEKCLLGALPVEGLYVNAGHSGTGFKIAPAVGLCLSELIHDGAAETVDISPFRWSRFKEGRPLHGDHPYSTSWHTGLTQ